MRTTQRWTGLGIVVAFGFGLAQLSPAAQARVEYRPIPGLPGVQSSHDGKTLTAEAAFGAVTEQPNYSYRALFTPNDPEYSLQWNLTDINMKTAWDADATTPIRGGDPGVIIAVLDTGIAYENFGAFAKAPDLANLNIWNNPGEVAGNGIDDDGNGFVDDINGWDFVNGDGHPNDDHAHGTHVTGTIAQSTNNGVATAGIAYETTIMPLKVLNGSGNGTTATIAAAINYATAKGANILNLSLGGDQDDPIVHAAIQAAVAQGVIIIAAAGNDGGSTINYPARYDEVVAVGATQFDHARAPYSDTGPSLDLVAPGGNLAVDQNSDGQPDGIAQQTCTASTCSSFSTYFYAGTSQAAAHVSGVAGLLGSCGAPSGSIIPALISTALDLGPAGHDTTFGHGLINATGALSVAGCIAGSPSPPTEIVARSSTNTGRNLVSHGAYPYTNPFFSWTGPIGQTYQVEWGKLNATPTIITQISQGYVPIITDEGAYKITVRSIDQVGRSSVSRSFTYRYRKPVFIVGQTSLDPGVRLYRPDPSFIRSWPGKIQSMPAHVAGGPLEIDGTNRILVTGQYWGTSVKVLSTRGTQILNLVPFDRTYRGGIDIEVLRRPNEGQFVLATRSENARLRWYNAAGKAIDDKKIYQTYRGGLELAGGDINGDGIDELIVSMSRSHEIRVYNWQRQRLSVFSPLGSGWRGGFAITTGDFDGDGNKEIIATPRTGGGDAPVFVMTLKGVVQKTWRLNTGSYRGEMDIQGIDVNGDGIDELLAANKSGPTFMQQWSLGGVLEKQYNLFTDGRGASLSALQ